MPSIVIALALLSTPTDELFSGPQKGEKTPHFKVLDVNGPNAGKEFDYLAEWKGAPTLICFVHELTRPGAQLIRRLDAYGMQNKDALRTLFVSLASDVQEAERRLPPSIKSIRWQCPVGISIDGIEGPGAYGLNKDVLLTIVAAKDDTVVANWAIVSPNETDYPKIQAVLDKLIEPALDSPEAMRAEILRLRAQLSALSAEVNELKGAAGRAPGRGRMEAGGERMEREARDKPAEKSPLPGKAPTDPKLMALFRRLIRPDADPGDVDQAVKEIEAHAKDNEDLRKQVADGLILIDHLGYGSDYSKTERKKLAEGPKK